MMVAAAQQETHKAFVIRVDCELKFRMVVTRSLQK